MSHAAARNLREDDEAGVNRRPDLHVVEGGRRTVRITGHPVPARRRPSAKRQQIVARPDRVALWAVMLGLFMALVAVATANAAPL